MVNKEVKTPTRILGFRFGVLEHGILQISVLLYHHDTTKLWVHVIYFLDLY